MSPRNGLSLKFQLAAKLNVFFVPALSPHLCRVLPRPTTLLGPASGVLPVLRFPLLAERRWRQRQVELLQNTGGTDGNEIWNWWQREMLAATRIRASSKDKLSRRLSAKPSVGGNNVLSWQQR
jgi:hypothetical protein